MEQRGTFITFEGTEGSGKTTQIGLLKQALIGRGLVVTVTREPGGTAIGDTLRSILLERGHPIAAETEAYLMTGARAEHVRRVIGPALEQGDVVLCDRFVDSTIAYQGAGRGVDTDALRSLQTLAVGRFRPTVTVLLDLPVEIGLRRRFGEGDINRFDQESVHFHERVASWYRSEARADPDRWIVVDATQDISVMHTAILKQVSERIGAELSSPVQTGMESR